MKENWKKFLPLYIGTILVILVPLVVGVINYDLLPETMAIHFSLSGEANGFSNKATAVYFFPILSLVSQLVIILSFMFSKKKVKAIIEILTLLIFPIISIIYVIIIRHMYLS